MASDRPTLANNLNSVKAVVGCWGAKAIPDQQHPDQQFGIDRRATAVAVEICKVGTDAAQVDKSVAGSKQVILRDVVLQRELIEPSRLRFLSRYHHCHSLPSIGGIESVGHASIKHKFSNKISS